MTLKENAIVLSVALLAAAGVLFYARHRIGSSINAAGEYVAETAQDGATAVGLITNLIVSAVTDPLDTFGISPGTFADGTPKWQKTTPWADAMLRDQERLRNSEYVPHAGRTIYREPFVSSDPVSDNNIGMNFNYF